MKGNIGNLMKQAQQMQANVQRVQAEIAALEVTGEAGGGMAKVTMNGKHEVTRVSFRPLTARDLAAYVASREWQGRAGAYAIQGLGAALVERIEGDYLNVVGLPAALLVRLLSERFAGVYGFG